MKLSANNPECKSILRHFYKQTDLQKLGKIVAMLFAGPKVRVTKTVVHSLIQIHHSDFRSLKLII